MEEVGLPTNLTLMNPTLLVLSDLGGSAPIEELFNEEV